MQDHGNDPVWIAGCALTLLTCIGLCDDSSLQEPRTKITGNSMEELEGKFNSLPDEPVGNGLCQLTKERLPNSRIIIPKCKGDCLPGQTCIGPIIRGRGAHIVVECLCN